MHLPANVVVEVVKAPTFWGVAVVLAILGFAYFRDIRNPEKAASNVVLTGMSDTTAQTFAMAQEAMTQAREANKSALESARANIRCEQRIIGFIEYQHVLTRQLVDAGIPPAPVPPGLLD